MELKLTLRLLTNEERIFGPGVAELLERVQEHHSLRSAAASMEMAYSKACKLLSSSTGGRHGGGASLTPEAERLLTAYRTLETEVNAYSQERFHVLFDSL